VSLWLRDWSLQIGTVLVRLGADPRAVPTMTFNVQRSLGREPNKASIAIANLSDTMVARLSGLDGPQVELRAGYQGQIETIFLGDARDIWTVTDGVTRWTKVEAQDGGTSYRTAELDRSFAAGTPVSTVIVACATAMGVGLGNAQSVAAAAELSSGGSTYPSGTSVSGPAWRSLDRVCRSCGLRWSVQTGVLQLRGGRRQAAVTSSVLLTPSTGLLGSPSRGARDRRGDVVYSATALLRPGIYPGRVVRIESRDLTATLLCSRTQHTGETTGPAWTVGMELKEYDA